ncbi:MAG: hypothetical protein ACYC1M_08885 [Armatimonadota bacterium]
MQSPFFTEGSQKEPAYKLALIAMIIGVSSLLCPLLCVLGLLVGIIAYAVSSRSQSAVSKLMSQWALSLSAVGLLVGFVIYLLVFPVVGLEKERGQQTNCYQNQKVIGMAMHMYADDNDGRLPLRENWQEPLKEYTRQSYNLRCSDSPNPELAYGMNGSMSGAILEKTPNPELTALAFDCAIQRASASGGPETVDFRHRINNSNIGNSKGVGDTRFANFSFADGHGASVARVANEAKLFTSFDKKPFLAFDKVRW